MTLGPPVGNPLNLRPHQLGRAFGAKRGVQVTVPVEWLVDSGADIGAVRKIIGDRFDLSPIGATASPTSGGVALMLKTGLTVEFTVENEAQGLQQVQSSLPVAVKSNDAGSNIVGMNQLASVDVWLMWNPSKRRGTLLAKGSA
jgi:hypothetical protein